MLSHKIESMWEFYLFVNLNLHRVNFNNSCGIYFSHDFFSKIHKNYEGKSNLIIREQWRSFCTCICSWNVVPVPLYLFSRNHSSLQKKITVWEIYFTTDVAHCRLWANYRMLLFEFCYQIRSWNEKFSLKSY